MGITTKRIEIEITGITPLLMHAFSDAAQIGATSGTRTSSAAGDKGTPKEQCEEVLYKQGDVIIMPQPNIFSCVIEAGKFFKAGKSKITTQKTSLIPGCCFFNDVYYPLEHDGWTVDTRPVRIPSTGGRILRHRPLFENWKVNFTVELDTGEMHEKLLREIIDAAGSKIGLGDFRPACKGSYGRFKVTRWQVVDEIPMAAE